MKAGVISRPEVVSDYSETIIVGEEGVVNRGESKKTIEDDVKRLLIPRSCLLNRINAMGVEIARDYKGKDIYAVIVLKGAAPFFKELTAAIGKRRGEIVYDFIRLSSYDGDRSSGKVKIAKDLIGSVEGKNVLIVEDIVDTGLTLDYLINYLLNKKNARSVRVCSLLNKPDRRLPEYKDLRIDYLGFEIPDVFVVGFGLDYKEKERRWNEVYALKSSSTN